MNNIDIEISTETVIDTIAELKNTDATVIQDFLKDLAKKGLSFGVQLIIAAIVFFIGTRIIKVVRKILRRALEKRDADPGVKQFLDSLVKVVCYLLLVFAILALFGVTTGSIIAIIGSAGLTIGLALQGSLANFAGGVLILLLKPFKVGDYIMEDSHKNEGTVTENTIFYTKLLTIDHRFVVVPNGHLSDTSIVNYTKMERRRLVYTVGIAYDDDLRKAKDVLRQVLMQEEGRIEDQPLDIYVDSLGDSAVNLGFRIWLPTERYWEMRWRIIEDVKLAFDENGIEIPYQKVDVAITKEPDKNGYLQEERKA